MDPLTSSATTLANTAHTVVLSGQTPPDPAWAGSLAIAAAVSIQISYPFLAQAARTLMKPQRCEICLGVGNNLCIACKGRGKQGGLFTGDPLQRCSTCGGRGRELCKKCNATGLSNNWLYKPTKNGGWGPRGG